MDSGSASVAPIIISTSNGRSSTIPAQLIPPTMVPATP